MDITQQLDQVMPTALWGSVAQTVGMTVSAAGFPAPVGALAEIERQTGGPMLAEVIGFRDELTILFPFAELTGVRHGNRVRLSRTSRWLRVGNELLGRVLDAEGNAVDGKPQPVLPDRPFDRPAPNPAIGPRIDAAVDGRAHRRPADLWQGQPSAFLPGRAWGRA